MVEQASGDSKVGYIDQSVSGPIFSVRADL
jgi:hypothetical protein